jgi:hypothetical protein
MSQLPVRGVIAPVFISLGLAAAILDLRLHSSAMIWLSLLSLTLALVFARDTRRLLSRAFKDETDA